jgi:hypothetical protein
VTSNVQGVSDGGGRHGLADQLFLGVADQDGVALRVLAVSFAALLTHLGEPTLGQLAACDGPRDGRRCAACPVPDTTATPVAAGPCTFGQAAHAVHSLGPHLLAITPRAVACPDCRRPRLFDELYGVWFHTETGEASCAGAGGDRHGC